MQKKKGISLVVLVITIISTYDEKIKTREVSPKNNTQTICEIIYDKSFSNYI